MGCFGRAENYEEHCIETLKGNQKVAHVMGSSSDSRNHIKRYKKAIKNVPESKCLNFEVRE